MTKEIVFPAKMSFVLQDCNDAPLLRNQVRGRTVCSLISQGTEIGWAQGDNFPIRPGYGAIFRVDDIGPDTRGVTVGELRFAMGAHRSVQTHAAADTLPVPQGLSPEVAVLARLMGVSMTTLMTTQARPGDAVIVTGAGPVGFLAAQLFTLGGYEVTVVEPDATRREQLRESGVSDCREAMPTEDPDLAGRVALVVECSGHEGATLSACRMVQKKGEVVLVGVPWRKLTSIDAHELLAAVFFNFVHLRSGWEWEVPVHSRSFIWEELLEGYNNAPHDIFGGFARALRWLAQGKIPTQGLIRVVDPLDPVSLYQDIASRKITEPFIVLDWSSLSE